MVVIALGTLRSCWEKHPESEQAIRAWYRAVLESDWSNPEAIKARFASVSILKAGRAVFNIKGNNFRVVTYIHYPTRTVFIKWIGTHDEYDEIDANEVQDG